MTTETEQLPPGRRTPLTDDYPTGPAVGERLPAFVLPDQHGTPVDFAAVTHGGRAVVFFHRSASWCPYCRTHLASFQRHLAAFEAAGIRVFAISNDPVEVLAAFAEENGITYPLLSDADSAVIRAFGILNTLIAPDEDRYGIAFPGVYVVGADGRVEEKLFYREYAIRESVGSLLHDILGADFSIDQNPRADVEGPGLRISATLAEERLTFMQRTPLYVRLDLDPGLHVYGAPVPAGFVATEVSVRADGDPEGVRVLEVETPPTAPFRVAGIDHEFRVFGGNVEFAVPIVNGNRDLESLALDVTVRFQACDDQQCFLPQTRALRVDVPLAGLNRPRPKA
ncbi:MAG: redoxin domain-containing protein [Dehalococcoidia bacterium]